MKLRLLLASSLVLLAGLCSSCKQSTPPDLVKSAEEAMDNLEFDSALQILNEALGINGDDVRLLELRGIVQLEREDHAAALSDLEQAATMAPNDPNIAVNLGAAHIAMGKFQSALKLLSDVIRQSEDDADAFRNRALAHLRLGNFEEAIADYTVALGLYDEVDPVLHEERAECWEGIGDTEAATVDRGIASATYELEEDPNKLTALVQRGLDLYNLGEFYHALLDLDDAVDAGSDSEQVFLARGNCLLVLEESEAALESLDQAIRLNSNNALAYACRANVREALAQWKEAIDDYQDALELEPENELARTELAWLLATVPQQELREGGRARELAEAAVTQTQGKDWRPVASLAAACAAVGDFEQATTHQKKAIALAPIDEQGSLTNDLKQLQEGKALTWKYPEPEPEE